MARPHLPHDLAAILGDKERRLYSEERRPRPPSVRSLADLDDTAIDYLSEPPSDGDTLVFDETLGNDLSPAGRWRPGAGGGGGGAGGWSTVRLRQTWDDATAQGVPQVLWLEAAPDPGPVVPWTGAISQGWTPLFAPPADGIWSVTVNSDSLDEPIVVEAGQPVKVNFGPAFDQMLEAPGRGGDHFAIGAWGHLWVVVPEGYVTIEVSAHWVGPAHVTPVDL